MQAIAKQVKYLQHFLCLILIGNWMMTLVHICGKYLQRVLDILCGSRFNLHITGLLQFNLFLVTLLWNFSPQRTTRKEHSNFDAPFLSQWKLQEQVLSWTRQQGSFQSVEENIEDLHTSATGYLKEIVQPSLKDDVLVQICKVFLSGLSSPGSFVWSNN